MTFLYCCMTSGNIILMSFLWSLLESQTATQALKLGEIYGCALHFRYSLHDAHQPECFELRLIFGFEQSSVGCRKKPSLTSLVSISISQSECCHWHQTTCIKAVKTTHTDTHDILVNVLYQLPLSAFGLQCFDTVGCAAGRASGL